jgi:hypothetical protein
MNHQSVEREKGGEGFGRGYPIRDVDPFTTLIE